MSVVDTLVQFIVCDSECCAGSEIVSVFDLFLHSSCKTVGKWHKMHR